MGRAPVVHDFGSCELWVWPETRYVETRYADGTRAGATRDCELNNATYARHLGYPDCWVAVLTHEAAHTLIAQRMGQTVSPTLWAVAHDYAPGTAPYEARLYEEALTLAVERYANTGDESPILRHPDVAPHYVQWAAELRALAGKLLTSRGAA